MSFARPRGQFRRVLLVMFVVASSASFVCAQNGNSRASNSGGGNGGGDNIQPLPTPISSPTPPIVILPAPTSGSWNNNTAAQVWSTAADWLSNAIADGAGATGNFTFNITTAGRTITIDGAVASRTLGIMNIGDTDASSSYTIAASGGGTLTFDNSGLNAQLNQTSTSASNTISAPIILNSSLDITNASGNTLTLSGGITATAGNKTITTSTGTVTFSTLAIGDGSGVIAVAQNGPGTLALGTLANTYSGGTTISGGKITIAGSGTPLGSGALTLSGGTLVSSASRSVAAATNVIVTADSAITTSSNSAATLPFSGTLTGTGGTLTIRNDGPATTALFDVRFSGGDYTMSQPIVIDNGAGGGTARLSDFNAPGSTHTYTGVISGTGSYNRSVSSGAGGNTVFTANNTYTGTTTVNAGTLELANSGSTSSGRISGTSGIVFSSSAGTLLLSGSSSFTDRINDSATMTLNGGTFNTGGLSEHGASNNTAGIGALTLQSTSIIDMGSGASIVAFADSHTATWAGTLKIYNYSGTPVTGSGTDQLYFGNSSSGLTSTQVGEITFFSDAGTTSLGGAIILADGEVVVAPEPGTWAAAALALSALAYTQRRRIARSFKRV